MFEGSGVALVTPFRNGSVDEKAIERLVEFQLSRGTDVLIPCGTTGEAATMSHEEHEHVIELVVGMVKGRVPVLAGAGSNATAEALRLIRFAKRVKASGVLVVTPYYNKPTQEGLYQHYAYLAGRVDIPFVLYNVPGRTGISIAPETVARLAKIPNIVAIKEASGSVQQTQDILALTDMTVLSGEDALTLPLMSVGARGAISVVANVDPRREAAMVDAALAGRWEEARALHYELLPLAKGLFMETNPIPVKAALAMMKKIGPDVRLPLTPLPPDKQKGLRSLLKKAGLL